MKGIENNNKTIYAKHIDIQNINNLSEGDSGPVEAKIIKSVNMILKAQCNLDQSKNKKENESKQTNKTTTTTVLPH